jgi:hypothetical protein
MRSEETNRRGFLAKVVGAVAGVTALPALAGTADAGSSSRRRRHKRFYRHWYGHSRRSSSRRRRHYRGRVGHYRPYRTYNHFYGAYPYDAAPEPLYAPYPIRRRVVYVHDPLILLEF